MGGETELDFDRDFTSWNSTTMSDSEEATTVTRKLPGGKKLVEKAETVAETVTTSEPAGKKRKLVDGNIMLDPSTCTQGCFTDTIHLVGPCLEVVNLPRKLLKSPCRASQLRQPSKLSLTWNRRWERTGMKLSKMSSLSHTLRVYVCHTLQLVTALTLVLRFVTF